jgi:N-carbamoyl-L-amino-acid hydrolase
MTVPAARADGARVFADLTALRQIGAYKTGVHRPSFAPEHMQSLRWLMQRLPDAGLSPALDGIGNVIGTSALPGPKLLAGSHLESQNHAGWLDGPLGVVYALEAARVLNTRANASGAVEVGCWADEEGHYGTLLGSRSYIGAVDESEIDAGTNHTTRKPLRTALTEAGLAGLPRLGVERGRHIGYLEAHIEQGDTLEREHLKIGVVTAIVGIWQYEITATGQQNHAGTTSMRSRKDAGLALAKLCVAIDEAFPKSCGPRSVWTTGRLTLEPGAPSIIPGRATMLFQMRDTDPAVITRLEGILDGLVADANRHGPCALACKRLRQGQPAAMDTAIQDAVAAAAEEIAPGLHLRMPSGAAHDAQFLAQVMPAGMLFVPSIGGISHHWTENTSDEDIVTGAHVFVAACARLLGRA